MNILSFGVLLFFGEVSTDDAPESDDTISSAVLSLKKLLYALDDFS